MLIAAAPSALPRLPMKPGLVEVAHEQHMGAELGLERHALDRDEARLVAGEQRAGDRARPPLLGRR